MMVYDLGEGYRVTLSPGDVAAWLAETGCATICSRHHISAMFQKRPALVLRHNVGRAASDTDKATLLRWMMDQGKRRLGL